MSAGPLVVLCVEDDADIATIVELSLALDPAIEVHVAPSGERAIEMLGAGLRPNVILLDAVLPGVAGVEVAKAIVASDFGPSFRIAFMTAAVRVQHIAEYRAVGAADVIAKPFDPMTLAERVRALASGPDDVPMHPNPSKRVG